ncbi:hypothetical protein B0F90DRAFT_1814273 [Multifurca ochricompacta]|uniref:Uncharacterized protein n=1 Tax=Multifurca ochricompacta TaxID=376703 RepID=A0AAD4QRW5_9AGAM|nr:hypothetical protein B0F90DRAFT_1814273 [Multifurca ochricompacta]
MSLATPTILPRPPLFPTLMPRPRQPYPTPLATPGRHVGRLILRRDFVQEMDDLSDEEAEFEDSSLEVKNRGYGFLVPIGKMLTQHEEKNDADDGSEVDESARSSHPESPTDEGEGDGEGNADGEGEGEGEDEDGGMDLDAEIEDMDDEIANTTAETEDFDDMDDETGELDE